MTVLIIIKLFLSIGLGMLAMPFGILPSILLFRGLANGTDSSERNKQLYALTLWGGLVIAWALGTWISWMLIGWLVG